MSKLVNKAKSSKLKENLKNTSVKKDIASKKRFKEYPRSYRFDSEVINVLKNTLDRVNEVSPRKVSEARLIKALVLLSQEASEDLLMEVLKKVW